MMMFVIAISDTGARGLSLIQTRLHRVYNPFVGFVFIYLSVTAILAFGFDLLDVISMDKNRHLMQLAVFSVQFFQVGC